MSEPQQLETVHTRCCIVGAGPAGMVLAICLARQGVPVTLLESHNDFEREFRGDTLHPSTLEILDQLGWADELLQIPHGILRSVGFDTPNGSFTVANFESLKTKFPYVAVMAQSKFLNFLAEHAKVFPCFDLRMGASVTQTISEDGRTTGICYQTSTGRGRILSPLVVGADGRFSRIRKVIGVEPTKSSPPMDVLWFRLPIVQGDPKALHFRIQDGHLLVLINRGSYWQLGLIVLKGTYREIKSKGIDKFQCLVKTLAPELADRVNTVSDWKNITPLNVEANYMPVWHKPGLLLIGDAAHVISPVGGVGINIAIQDAVEAANLLGPRLKIGTINDRDLAKVQKKRGLSVRMIQAFQSFLQHRIVKTALQSDATFRPPIVLNFPFVKPLIARVIGFGPRKVRLARHTDDAP